MRLWLGIAAAIGFAGLSHAACSLPEAGAKVDYHGVDASVSASPDGFRPGEVILTFEAFQMHMGCADGLPYVYYDGDFKQVTLDSSIHGVLVLDTIQQPLDIPLMDIEDKGVKAVYEVTCKKSYRCGVERSDVKANSKRLLSVYWIMNSPVAGRVCMGVYDQETVPDPNQDLRIRIDDAAWHIRAEPSDTSACFTAEQSATILEEMRKGSKVETHYVSARGANRVENDRTGGTSHLDLAIDFAAFAARKLAIE